MSGPTEGAQQLLSPLPMLDVGIFHSQDMDIAMIDPSLLYRIGRHNSGEPYFGQSRMHRFDSPNGIYGTCYLGYSLECAFAESVLHDLTPKDGKFRVAVSELESRWVSRFSGKPLLLCDLTGAMVVRYGGGGRLTADIEYKVPQQWSETIHGHPQNVDGVLYMSRFLPNTQAVALYDRAKAKIPGPTEYREFITLPEAQGIVTHFKVEVF